MTVSGKLQGNIKKMVDFVVNITDLLTKTLL